MTNKSFSRIFAFALALLIMMSSVLVVGAYNPDAGYSFEEINGEMILTEFLGGGNVIDLTEDTLGWKIDRIAEGVFANRSDIERVIIPENIIEIGKEAFKDCENLKEVVITGINLTTESEQFKSVTEIGDSAFEDCVNLSEIKITGCSVKFGVDVFKNTAFFNNEANWSEGVLYLDNYLIKANPEKVSGHLKVKDGTTSLAGQAIYKCNSLESLEIPESILVLGETCISSNNSLLYAEFYGSPFSCSGDALWDNNNDFIIYCNEGYITSICSFTRIPYLLMEEKVSSFEDIGVQVIAPKNMDVKVSHYYAGNDRYAVTFRCDSKIFKILPKAVNFRVPIDRRNEILCVYNEEAKRYVPTEYNYVDGYAEFECNHTNGFLKMKYTYVSTIDEATGIKIEYPQNYKIAFDSVSRGDEAVNFDVVDDYTPEGYFAEALYGIILLRDEIAADETVRLTLSIPVEDEDYVVLNVDDDLKMTNVNAEHNNGYLEFDYYDLEYGAGVLLLCKLCSEQENSTNDEATFDETSTSDEEKTDSTIDELTPSTEDESTLDEPQQDNSTGDEEPSDPTPDQSGFMIGDVNRDGRVNIRDVTAIQKNLAKLLSFDEEQVKLADVNKDSKNNIKDATYIQKILAKLI